MAVPPTFALEFVLFTLLLMTPGVVISVLYVIKNGTLRSEGRSILAAGILAVLGTFLVLQSIRASMEISNPYQDSRFFLFISLMMLLSIGPLIKYLKTTDKEEENVLRRIPFLNRNKEAAVVFLIVMVGFAPLYGAIPQGVEQIRVQNIAGWSSINEISMISSDSDVFLVCRAREFSWLTGRKTVNLDFGNRYLPDSNASERIMNLALSFGATYLVIDNYTVTRWDTLKTLYRDKYTPGQTLILNYSRITDSNAVIIDSVFSVSFVHQTKSDNDGNYISLFSFCWADYAKYKEISLLSNGWAARNEGQIENISSVPRLVIGSNKTFTGSFRVVPYDLDLETRPGFILFNITVSSVTIWRIQIWDADGKFVNYVWGIGSTLYSAYTGLRTVGDIHIVIEGVAGGFATINSISLWKANNSLQD